MFSTYLITISWQSTAQVAAIINIRLENNTEDCLTPAVHHSPILNRCMVQDEILHITLVYELAG